MSDVKIKSENQSGGITAQNVNTGNGTTFGRTNSDKEPGIKKIFWWVFGLASLLAAAVTVYKFFFS